MESSSPPTAVPATRRRRLPRWTKRVVILILPLACGFVWLLRPVKIVVSLETTWITGPLRTDGMPDYQKWWDDQRSAGVTLENNAAALVFATVSPNVVDERFREEFYRRLGIAPPQLEDCISDLNPYFAARNLDVGDWGKLYVELYSDDQLFTSDKFPELAIWLRDNARRVELLEQASRRERFYYPLPLDEPRPTLLSGNSHFLDQSALVRCKELLILQKKSKQAAGDLDGAMEGALTVHRLARLIAGNGQFIDVCTGYDFLSFSSTAGNSEDPAASILLDQRLTLEQVRRFRKRLQELPPFPHLTPAINSERVIWLEEIVSAANSDTGRVQLSWELEPNRLLRSINRWHDELIADYEIADPARRWKSAEATPGFALEKVGWLSRSISGFRDGMRRNPNSAPSILTESDFAKRSAGSVLYLASLPMFDRVNLCPQLLDVTAAVVEHRLRTGALPGSLEKLVPSELRAIPIDPWSGQPFRYVTRDRRFCVYSVFNNGTDDGGNFNLYGDVGMGDLILTPAPQ